MKIRHLIMILAFTSFMASCSKETREVKSQEFYFNDILLTNVREATEQELKILQDLGYLNSGILNRDLTCEWADGQFGSVSCNNGSCSVVFSTGVDGNSYAALRCSNADGSPRETGGFRPIE